MSTDPIITSRVSVDSTLQPNDLQILYDYYQSLDKAEERKYPSQNNPCKNKDLISALYRTKVHINVSLIPEQLKS